ncbi:MAG: phosphoribosylanthranilate isomerase [Planctomycetes bacterium]|nr:phosphoribosylanthranilate isomerase [Planctomycetota bacterium]
MSSRTTRIKICGITSIEIANVATNAGADIIGLMVNVPASPRNLSIEKAQEIAKALPPQTMVVVVMQNESAQIAEQIPSTWVQLHGDEDEQTVAEFAKTKHVIKGFRFDIEQVKRWNADPHIDVLLIDGSSGGKGESFDHQQLAQMMPTIEKPIILAGGLNTENVGDAIRTVRPFCVDVSSAVETAPGEKDPALIHAFCEAVIKADNEVYRD